MKTRSHSASAFTLIEMLVVISIIAVLAAFAVPALTSALTKGQMTGTLNNARQFYLAGQQMELDGAANADASLTWPGDYSDAATLTLKQYTARLVQNDYLKTGDLTKLLSAPGSACTASSTTDATGLVTVDWVGSPALKAYLVKEADASNTIFAVSANYTYDTALL